MSKYMVFSDLSLDEQDQLEYLMKRHLEQFVLSPVKLLERTQKHCGDVRDLSLRSYNELVESPVGDRQKQLDCDCNVPRVLARCPWTR